jgi:TatD DNase family protein
MLIDTHAHLIDERFDGDREDMLQRAKSAGIGLIVQIADCPEEWGKSLALARARPEHVRCTLGLHPYYADQWKDSMTEELKQKAKLPEVVGAGEVGLDYAKCDIPKDIQKKSMRLFCEAAKAADLPVVIHCRDAYEDLLPILKEQYGGSAPTGKFHGVVHCFSGDTKDALESTKLGFALGVDGPVTYPKNKELRDALKAAGIENLVLETDSPWLPPQSSRGKRNEPHFINEIAEKLAEVFSIKKEEVAALTTQNARDLFRLNG